MKLRRRIKTLNRIKRQAIAYSRAKGDGHPATYAGRIAETIRFARLNRRTFA